MVYTIGGYIQIETWQGAIFKYLNDLWKGEEPVRTSPTLSFDHLTLRRISDEQGYALLGKNPFNAQRSKTIVPFDHTLWIIANSAADVEVGLMRMLKNEKIIMVTFVFHARPHLSLPDGRLHIRKHGNSNTLEIYGEGILQEMPSPMTDGTTQLNIQPVKYPPLMIEDRMSHTRSSFYSYVQGYPE